MRLLPEDEYEPPDIPGDHRCSGLAERVIRRILGVPEKFTRKRTEVIVPHVERISDPRGLVRSLYSGYASSGGWRHRRH